MYKWNLEVMFLHYYYYNYLQRFIHETPKEYVNSLIIKIYSFDSKDLINIQEKTVKIKLELWQIVYNFNLKKKLSVLIQLLNQTMHFGSQLSIQLKYLKDLLKNLRLRNGSHEVFYGGLMFGSEIKKKCLQQKYFCKNIAVKMLW